jgi:Ca-activated chloride channel family protein
MAVIDQPSRDRPCFAGTHVAGTPDAISYGMRQSCLACSAAFAIGLASVSVLAQEQRQPSFRSGTAVVSIFATVTDAQGRLVPDLIREDFEVFDNDKQQPIITFENDVQPITVVVMLDTSASMTHELDTLFAASEQFLIRLLPEDRGRVGAFNDKIEFNGGFSNDRDELIGAVKDLDYGNGTRLWDAIDASLSELRGIQGRRVILVFTDGDDTSSRVGLGDVLERARAEEVMVYTIGLQTTYFDGVRMVRSRPSGGLKRLAEETGGGFFELKKGEELGATFTRVAQELHSQYVIAFEAPQLDGKLHRLSVRVNQPGMSARARRNYVADPALLSR